MRRRGFTLVELLIVIGIIALLMAVLIPGLRSARTTARRTRCLANMRELTRAAISYITTDWNSLIPRDPVMQWIPAIGSSDVSRKLSQCPGAVMPADSVAMYGFGSPGTAYKPWMQISTAKGVPNFAGAYAFNSALYLPSPAVQTAAAGPPPPAPSGPPTGSPGPHPWPLPPGVPDEDNDRGDMDDVTNLPPSPGPPQPPPPSFTPIPQKVVFYKLSELNKPFAVPVFADGIWPETYPLPGDVLPVDLENGFYHQTVDQMGRLTTRRHAKLVNVSFLDGHAESMRLPQLWTLEWHQGWVTPKLPTDR